MNKAWEMVYEFNKIGGEVRDIPTALDTAEREFRAKLLLEEIQEFVDSEHLINQVDGIIDLMYIALGVLTRMGVRPEEVFRIVHKANMAKFPEGKKILREDGKIMKPDDWVAPEPEIARELARQHIVYSPEWQTAIYEATGVWEVDDIMQVIAMDDTDSENYLFVGVMNTWTFVAFSTNGNRWDEGDNLAKVVQIFTPEERQILNYPE